METDVGTQEILLQHEGILYGRLIIERPLEQWPADLIDAELLDIITLMEFEEGR